MDKKSDIVTPISHRAKKRSVRMAYTLNNSQPVVCTLVSDQPFFYLDEENALEDDFLLDDELLEEEFFNTELESQLAVMKNKIDLYERNTKQRERNNKKREDDFIQSYTTDDSIELSDLLNLLKESRIAHAYLDDIYARGIYIQNSNHCESAHYDAAAKTIFIRDDLPKTEAVFAMLTELRRAWQEGQQAAVNPLTLHPDYAVLVNRVQQADIMVGTVRAAWELKLAGHEDIWKHVDQSSMRDMGRALAREALADFRTLNNAKAQAAAFETWFLSDRCKDADKSLINAMLAGYDKFTINEEGLKTAPVAQIIARVGEMPFGKNYLASYTHMIMQDGLFTEVRDRANANFLWFIKFERAFDETEQALQSSGALPMPALDPQISAHIDVDNGELFDEELQYDKQERPFDDNIIHVAFGYPQDQYDRQ